MDDTDCRKCGAAMPACKTISFGPYRVAEFKVTAYRCEKCGHWNDLKRRKPKPSKTPQESSR